MGQQIPKNPQQMKRRIAWIPTRVLRIFWPIDDAQATPKRTSTDDRGKKDKSTHAMRAYTFLAPGGAVRSLRTAGSRFRYYWLAVLMRCAIEAQLDVISSLCSVCRRRRFFGLGPTTVPIRGREFVEAASA
jgi:hypothetical protein